MKIRARGVGETCRTWHLTMLLTLSCGGSEFSAAPLFEPVWPDAHELDAASRADAGDVYIRHDVGRGDEVDLRDVPSGLDDDAAVAPACDLRPCLDPVPSPFGQNCANGTRYALCCASGDLEHPKGGACAPGATCFCGVCPSSSYDRDAGRCN